ncbi:formin-like protein 20 [Patiria miniata]|uniref:RING-type domain-containing protein n=1 Tax=Patiria miniata TaxID=46514 RepID=A0A913Z4D7_PATMI|nr:formin-like protein 20 [Patiria miniata]
MSCAICMEQLQQSQQPKVLSCGHSFCLACIEHWFDSKQRRAPKDGSRRRAVRCPVCLQYTPLPTEGLTSLPTNFALLEAREENSIKLCDDDDGDRSSRMCLLHVGKILEFQCKTCAGQLVCRQCVGSQHRPAAGHRIGSLASLVRRQSTERAELEQMVMELQMRTIELTESNAVLQLDLLDRESNSKTNFITTTEKDINSEKSGTGETSKSETGCSSDDTVILGTETYQTQPRPRLRSGNLPEGKRRPPPVPPNLKTKSLPYAGLERKYGVPPPPPSSHTRDNRQSNTLPIRSPPPPPPSSANQRSAGQGLPTSSHVADGYQPRRYPSRNNRQPHTLPPPPPTAPSENHRSAGPESPTSSTAVGDQQTVCDRLAPSVLPRRHQPAGVTRVDSRSLRPHLHARVPSSTSAQSDNSMTESPSHLETNQQSYPRRSRGMAPPPPPPRPKTRPPSHPAGRST